MARLLLGRGIHLKENLVGSRRALGDTQKRRRSVVDKRIVTSLISAVVTVSFQITLGA
jgi:hypothetical protein